MTPALGRLDLVPAATRLDLLAAPVVPALPHEAWVCEIDPALADTAAFCAAYDVPLEASANCVVVAGRRGATTTLAAVVVLATTRADVNGAVKRRLDARKASFAPMDEAVEGSGMEYGGITPVGLPWPVLVDAQVVEQPWVVVGSGVRRSKLVLPGPVVGRLGEVSTWA